MNHIMEMIMNHKPNTAVSLSAAAPAQDQFDRRIGELLSGIAHALPDIVLGIAPLHTAQSRALAFRAAFAANRTH
jgi:hypothetical protein